MRRREKFPHPETVFPGGYEVFKKERVPMFEQWGWIAHHPQFIFNEDNYAQIMYDMFNEIHLSGEADDPESPWYPYVQDFLFLRACGRFDPEGRIGAQLGSGYSMEEVNAARERQSREAKRQVTQEILADAAAPRPAPQGTQGTHACADVQEEQGTLPPAKPRVKRGAAVPEGSLW